MERIDYSDKIKILSSSIADCDSQRLAFTPNIKQRVVSRITGASLPTTLKVFNSQIDFMFDEPLREIARCHYENARMVPSLKILKKEDGENRIVEMLVQAYFFNNRDSDRFKFLTIKYGRDGTKIKSIFSRMAEDFDAFMQRDESCFVSELILPSLISIHNVLKLGQNI